MKILIVEDDPSLREMLAITVAQRLDAKFHLAEMENFAHVVKWALGEHLLLLADNLNDALRMVGEADGVLCDGNFPGSRCQVLGAGENLNPLGENPNPDFSGARQNWFIVLGLAAKRRIPFALLSGDDALVERARMNFILARLTAIAAAFTKPMETTAALNWLFEAIRGRRESRVGSRESDDQKGRAA